MTPEERAIVREVEELLAEDVLVETEPACRYPPHRGCDWRAPDGRLICGVCHPPAAGSSS